MPTSQLDGEKTSHPGSGDPRWQAVEQLVASAPFVRSPRLAQLLFYLATQTIAGRSSEITEAEIAIEVFSRGGDFDPASDTIVRSHMLRLRQRLAQLSIKGAQFDISLPKGQYALDFERTALPAPEPAPPSIALPLVSPPLPSVVVPPTSTPSRRYGWALYILLMGFLLAVGYDIYIRTHALVRSNRLLWGQLIGPNQPTLLVNADSSLVLVHHFLQHDTSLADYTSGAYLSEIRSLEKNGIYTFGLAGRRYTSMVDVQMAQSLAELATQFRGTLKSRYPRDITIADIRNQNVILSGSRGANPWLELFEPKMNFVIAGDYTRHTTIVRNREPQGSEQAEYISDESPSHTIYGVLAFLPGIDPSKNVLILEGTSLPGTEAIYDFVFDHDQLEQLLKQFKNRDGSLKHFEVLLSSKYLNGNAATFQPLASRTYP